MEETPVRSSVPVIVRNVKGGAPLLNNSRFWPGDIFQVSLPTTFILGERQFRTNNGARIVESADTTCLSVDREDEVVHVNTTNARGDIVIYAGFSSGYNAVSVTKHFHLRVHTDPPTQAPTDTPTVAVQECADLSCRSNGYLAAVIGFPTLLVFTGVYFGALFFVRRRRFGGK